MGKILMLKQKALPSGFSQGSDYSDLKSLKERTLLYLLPDFRFYPNFLMRDLFDFYIMMIFDQKTLSNIEKFKGINPRKINDLDELLNAIELFESIESKFNAHFGDKKVERKLSSESPLRVLKHLVDLSKKVPPFVRERSSNQWFS
jgi:hypothetical protein